MNEAPTFLPPTAPGRADGGAPAGPGRRAWPLRLASGALLSAALAGCVVAPPKARSGPPPRSSPAIAAAPMYFYPVRGQSEEQLDRDRYACYQWASDQTGASPGMTPIRAGTPEPGSADGHGDGDGRRAERQGALAGAVIGAAAGAALSSGRHAAGNAVLGAIFGATIGTLAGVQQDRARSVQPAPAPTWRGSGVSDDFRRAMSACMAGRGYRIG